MWTILTVFIKFVTAWLLFYVFQAGSLRLICLQGYFLLKAVCWRSLAIPWLVDPFSQFLLPSSHRALLDLVSVSNFLPFIRTPVISDQGLSLLQDSLTLNLNKLHLHCNFQRGLHSEVLGNRSWIYLGYIFWETQLNPQHAFRHWSQASIFAPGQSSNVASPREGT